LLETLKGKEGRLDRPTAANGAVGKIRHKSPNSRGNHLLNLVRREGAVRQELTDLGIRRDK